MIYSRLFDVIRSLNIEEEYKKKAIEILQEIDFAKLDFPNKIFKKEETIIFSWVGENNKIDIIIGKNKILCSSNDSKETIKNNSLSEKIKESIKKVYEN